MRFRKMTGLILVLALSIAALAGVHAASAKTVVLCEVHEHRCSRTHSHAGLTGLAEKNKEKGLQVVTFEFPSISPVTCETSELKTGGVVGAEKAESWSFGSCSSGCEAKSANLPYSAVLTTTTADNGTLTFASGGSGNPAVSVTCEGTPCTYGVASLPLEVKGGSPAIVSIGSTLSKTAGGLFCPTSTTLKGAYQVTAPKTGYVGYRTESPAPGGTLLCEVSKEACPEEFVRGLDFLAKAGATLTPYPSLGAISCSESTLGLESAESKAGEGKPPLLGSVYVWTFGGCAFNCKLETNVPLAAALSATGGGAGVFSITGKPTLTISGCAGSLPKCVFGGKAIEAKLVGGELATMKVETELPWVEGPTVICSAAMPLKVEYKVTEPATPLYVR